MFLVIIYLYSLPFKTEDLYGWAQTRHYNKLHYKSIWKIQPVTT